VFVPDYSPIVLVAEMSSNNPSKIDFYGQQSFLLKAEELSVVS